MRGIQAASYLSGVPHLRVRQPRVGETINKDADWLLAFRVYGCQAATSLCLQLNAPILCEGPAVETPCDVQNLVTFEIPPRVSLRVPEVLDELVLLRDRARDSAQQGLNSG